MKKYIIFVFLILTAFKVKGQVITYTYDNLNRITQAIYPDNSSVNYTYDASGNRATLKTTNANYRAAQTITFKAIGSKVYGTADIDPGATATSKFPVGYLSATPTVAAIINGKIHITGVGTSVISAVQAGGTGFLAADTVRQILTVTPASLTVKANDQIKASGAINPPLTFKYTGFITGEDSTKLTVLPVAITTATTGSAVGTYPITVSGGAAANYTFTYLAGTLTIGNSTDASLSNLTLTAGLLIPVFNPSVLTYSTAVANSVNSMNFTPTTGNELASMKINGVVVVSGTASVAIPLNVGVNTITIVIAAQDGKSTKTYMITVTRAKADQVITFQPLVAVNYGNKDITPTVNSTGISAVTYTSSNLNVATVSPANAIHIVGEGTTTITAAQPGDSNTNAATPVSQNLVVNPAVVTISANNATKITGTPNPRLTVSYSGFVNGEDSTQLSTKAVAVTTAATNSPAGIYPITASGAAAGNYIFNYVAGALTVKAIPLPVITAFAPASAIAGSTVTITGGNFTGIKAVSFGGTPAASFTVISPTSVTAVVGSGSSGNVSLTTNGGTATLPGFNFIFSLPSNNFQISATSVTCKGSANGEIGISALQNFNYTATVNGPGVNNATYSFTTTKTVANLSPGTYNICITVAGQPDYQQCFTSVITEPKDLSLYSVVLKNPDQVILSLNGADTYNIDLNGNITTTNNNQVTLSLKNGVNNITVSSDKPCQGVLKQSFIIANQNAPFPNPFENEINVNLGTDIIKKADISIYDAYSRLVYSNTFQNQLGVVQLNVSGLGLGVFVLKLKTDGQETIFKMIKK